MATLTQESKNTDKTRLTARVEANVFEKISYAASLQGSVVSQFLVSSALEKAETIIRNERMISLTMQESDQFMKLLEEPAKPNKRLFDAFNSFMKDDLNVEYKG